MQALPEVLPTADIWILVWVWMHSNVSEDFFLMLKGYIHAITSAVTELTIISVYPTVSMASVKFNYLWGFDPSLTETGHCLGNLLKWIEINHMVLVQKEWEK